jgi:hypothetical protein
MSVIHTLDTLDIPPSLAPFSLAGVNQAWQGLSPEETANLKKHQAMIVPRNNNNASHQSEDLAKKCRA